MLAHEPRATDAPIHGMYSSVITCLMQLPSSFYETYAMRLVSWGYAVLRYDLPGIIVKRIVPDNQEARAAWAEGSRGVAWGQERGRAWGGMREQG